MMIFHKRLKNGRSIISQSVVIMSLLSISLSEILFLFEPKVILGKNAYLIFGSLVMISISILELIGVFRRILLTEIIGVVALGASLIGVLLYQFIIYDQFHGFVFSRFFFTLAFASLFAGWVVREIGVGRSVQLALFVCAVVCAVQLIGYTLLPEIQILKQEGEPARIIFDGEATRDGLLGSSLVAYHAVVGIMLSYWFWSNGALKTIVLTFFSIVIIATQTRIAFFVLGLFLLVEFLKPKHFRKAAGMIATLFVLASCAVTLDVPLFDGLASRLQQGVTTDPRLAKLGLSFELAGASLEHFLMGVPAVIINSRTSGGVMVSDNSFFLILLNFGAVATVIWALWFAVSLGPFSIRYVMYPTWFVIALFTTNSLLWDSFILIMVLLGKLITHHFALEAKSQFIASRVT